MIKQLLLAPVAAIFIFGNIACSDQSTDESPEKVAMQNMEQPVVKQQPTKVVEDTIVLDVYKSPTCSCCAKWITHLEERGFVARTQHPDSMSAIKESLGIHNHVQSCHTAVTESGYVFEGHIPAKIMKRFLDNVPENALGLTVPAMPVGSPGMEVKDKFNPYTVMLLKKDGSVEPYAEVKTQAEQY